MGDFARHRVDTLHDVFLHDERGGLLGRLTITASVTLSESWAHLDEDPRVPSAPAGPHNRRLIETPAGFTLTAYGQTSEHPPGVALQVLVDELRANEGLEVNGAVVGYRDDGFEAAVRARLASLEGSVVTFRKAP